MRSGLYFRACGSRWCRNLGGAHMARDRLWVLLVVATLALLAWADLLAMGGMEDPTAGWSWTHFAAVLAMWVVMMAAMMIPSALPAILLFQSLRRTFPGPATLETLAFSGGYVATLTGFSVLAAGAQGMLAHATLLTPAWRAPLSGSPPFFSGS